MLKTLNSLYKVRLQKGGPGSGRYPAGSGEHSLKFTDKEKEDIYRLDNNQKKDYLEHRLAGTDHETSIALAEKKPETKEDIKARMDARHKEMEAIDTERERLGMKPQFKEE